MERWRPSQAYTKQEQFILKRVEKKRKLFGFLRRHRPETNAIASGATGSARLVPVLSLHAQPVKGSGPTPGDEAKEVGPLGWRAIQDSNLWPSAPEADALSI